MSRTRYVPKEWKGRLGTGLNKYVISSPDETGKQTITSAPTEITQEGDALSATNLNAFEQRIKDEFDVVVDALDAYDSGTTAVEKAKKDGDGNVIKTTYATKTELSNEVTARQNAVSNEQNARQTADTNEQNARIAKDNDLQSQIVNVNKEVETLDAIVGGEAEVDHIDPEEGQSIMAQSRLISYPNLLPNGSFGRVGARSVAWNQMLPSLDSFSRYKCSLVSYSDGVLTVNGFVDDGAQVYKSSIVCPSGRTTVGGIWVKPSKAVYMRIGLGSSVFLNDVSVPANEWTFLVNVKILPSATSEFSLFCNVNNVLGADDTVQVKGVFFSDLTAMNMASLSADQFRSLFPASYYPHDSGHIYDLNPSGFRIRGINLWDEEWELGVISSTTGEDYSSNSNIRSKNYFEVSPSKTYYLMSSNIVYIRQYDENKNFIATGNTTAKNSSFTTEPNCHFLKFFVISDYGTTYNHDIQICDNSFPDAIKTTYHPSEHHIVDTPQIADGHYVNEDVYDYVENVVEDGIVKGKKHTKVGAVDLGTLNYSPYSTYTGTFYALMPSNSASPIGGYGIGSLCGKYVRENASGYMTGDKCYICNSLGMTTQKVIYLKDTAYTDATAFKASLSGVMLYYELATETITDCEPLRSFDISDYSTVEPITPQNELVNRIDVPFSVLTKSNNGIIQQITTNKENIDKHTSILSNHNKRLRNLEHKSGDYEEMIYPDEDYGMDNVPPGVEEYAIVEGVEGVSRVDNRLPLESPRSVSTSGVNITYDSDTGKFTITGQADATSSVWLSPFDGVIAGHTYLIGNTAPNVKVYLANISEYGQYILPTALATSQYLGIRLESGKNYNDTFEFIVKDLSVYFGGTIPSDADTIAKIQTNYPHLLLPSDYGTRIVDWTGNGVKSVGVNLFNPYAEQTVTTFASATISDNGDTITITGLYYCQFDLELPAGSYFVRWRAGSGNTHLFRFYFEDGSISDSKGNNTTLTVTKKIIGLMLYCASSTLATSVYYDVQVARDDSPVKTTYHRYKEPSTLSFPSTTLKSAGSVRDTLELCAGIEQEINGQKVTIYKKRETERIGSYTFTGNESLHQYSTGHTEPAFSFYATGKAFTNNVIFAEGSHSYASTMGTMELNSYRGATDSTEIIFLFSGITTASAMLTFLTGKTVYFELADPVVTLSDPILDPLVKVEPNGTIEAIQSQETKIDGSMTVGYMYQ